MLKNPIGAKKCFGYVSDEQFFYETMTGIEYINFIADIYGINQEQRKTRFEYLDSLLNLKNNVYKQISTYSHGMKQKLSLIVALIHDPNVLILDEPFVGLDVPTSRNLKNIFKDYKKNNKTVIYITHNLDIAQALCDRLYLFSKGSIKEVIDIHEFNSNNEISLEEYYANVFEGEADE